MIYNLLLKSLAKMNTFFPVFVFFVRNLSFYTQGLNSVHFSSYLITTQLLFLESNYIMIVFACAFPSLPTHIYPLWHYCLHKTYIIRSPFFQRNPTCYTLPPFLLPTAVMLHWWLICNLATSFPSSDPPSSHSIVEHMIRVHSFSCLSR